MSASHPVWVRGLKHHETICCTMYAQVAPRVGAWIETVYSIMIIPLPMRRTPCGCVD